MSRFPSEQRKGESTTDPKSTFTQKNSQVIPQASRLTQEHVSTLNQAELRKQFADTEQEVPEEGLVGECRDFRVRTGRAEENLGNFFLFLLGSFGGRPDQRRNAACSTRVSGKPALTLSPKRNKYASCSASSPPPSPCSSATSSF